MSYIRGEDRGQVALLPAMIEDYLAADAPVPVIEAFCSRDYRRHACHDVLRHVVVRGRMSQFAGATIAS